MPEKWDGRAGERIVQILAEQLARNATVPRLTEVQIQENAS